MLGIIGKKLGMTQIFLEDGRVIPVTAILAGPCTITQQKSLVNDGYTALQLGFDEKRPKRTKKPLQGHFKKANISPKRILHEFRVNKEELDAHKLGQEITVDTILKADDSIDVTGTSKGRGFTGVIKRHGFKGGKASHGVHEYHRHGGSIGMSSFPARVLAGTKMAGHHGNQKVTVQNLKVVQVNKEKNVLFIKGGVPGPTSGYLVIKKAVKKKQK